MESYFKVLKMNEESGDKNGIAKVLNNIGNVYRDQHDYPKALEYFFKSLKMNEELGSKFMIALNLVNIGLVYADQKDYPKALEYYLKSLKMNEELGNKSGIGISLTTIGLAYWNQSDYPKALEYDFKALKINEELGSKFMIAVNLGSIGSAYLSVANDTNKVNLFKLFAGNKTKALQQAKIYTDSAIVIDKEIGNLNYLFKYYQSLSSIDSSLEDNKGALESYKNYSLFKDSVFNMEKDKKLTQTAMQYEFNKKEAATKAEQDKKDSVERTIRNSTFAGLAGLLVFSIVVYRQRNKVKKEKARSEELLLNILPAEVAEELKAKGSAEAKEYDEVTVLFTDFKGFTTISEKLTPAQSVGEINHCFSAFDNIIHKYRIEKIKTIGDAYMCAGGLPAKNNTHADDVVKAAIEIRNFMENHKQEKLAKGETPFEIRIGINTGPVVAGIVGVKKFAYDIWGDTVNIAARMEQSSEAGKVNISGTTYELVKDKFKCVHRGKVQAKNKGGIDMYFVEKIL